MSQLGSNAEFDWDFDASEEVRDAFVGRPRRTLLRGGWIGTRFTTARQNSPIGEWWVDLEVLGELAEQTQRAGRIGIQTAAREGLAITREWSLQLNQLHAYRFLHPNWAWVGQASPQAVTESGLSHRLLMGGFEQIFIPRLSAADVVRIGTAGPYLARAGHG
jgi:hypothetical protein